MKKFKQRISLLAGNLMAVTAVFLTLMAFFLMGTSADLSAQTKGEIDIPYEKHILKHTL